MKSNYVVRSFEPFSVFRFCLLLGLVVGLINGFFPGSILSITGKVPGGLAYPAGMTIILAFWVAVKGGAQSLIYNLFVRALKGVKLTFIETDKGAQIRAIDIWSVIRLAIPTLVLLCAFFGLAFGTILKMANVFELETPILYYMPNVSGAVLIGALLGLLWAIFLVLAAVIYNLFAYIFCTGYRVVFSSPENNSRTLVRFDVNSIFGLSLVIGIVWGIIFAFALPIILPLSDILYILRNLSLGDFIRLGIVTGICWAFMISIKALLYNLIATIIPGIKIELEKVPEV